MAGPRRAPARGIVAAAAERLQARRGASDNGSVRARLWIPLAACAAALLATDAPAQPAAAGGGAPASQEDWTARLEAAQMRLDRARQRVGELEAAYSRARRNDHPRGAARQALLDELAGAREELADAEASLPKLVEQARRAGALPEVLRPYRD